MLIAKANRGRWIDQRTSGFSLSFDGTTEQLFNSAYTSGQITGDAFSIMVTCTHATTAADALIYCYNSGTTQGFTIDAAATGNLTFAVTGSGVGHVTNISASTGLSLLAGQGSANWYKYMFTYDGTTGRIYGNGQSIGTDTGSPVVTNDSFRYSIASTAALSGVGSSFWDGSIYEVILWDTALTSTQVIEALALNYNPFQGSAGGNVKHWWRMGLPALGPAAGTTYISDSVASGGIDLSTSAANMADADIVAVYPTSKLVWPMAYTSSGNKTTTSSYSFNYTVPALSNRALIVAIGSRDATSAPNTVVSSVTYGGVALTQVNTQANGGGGATAVRSDLWILTNPTVGTASVAITLAGTVNQSIAAAMTFGNIDQSTSQDAASTGSNANAANATGSITTVTNGAAVLSCICHNNNTGLAGSSSQYEVAEIGDGTNYEVGIYVLEAPTAGAITTNITNTAAKYGYCVMALRPSA